MRNVRTTYVQLMLLVFLYTVQQEESVYLPELLHNINLLVEKTEAEIVNNDKK